MCERASEREVEREREKERGERERELGEESRTLEVELGGIPICMVHIFSPTSHMNERGRSRVSVAKRCHELF